MKKKLLNISYTNFSCCSKRVFHKFQLVVSNWMYKESFFRALKINKKTFSCCEKRKVLWHYTERHCCHLLTLLTSIITEKCVLIINFQNKIVLFLLQTNTLVGLKYDICLLVQYNQKVSILYDLRRPLLRYMHFWL